MNTVGIKKAVNVHPEPLSDSSKALNEFVGSAIRGDLFKAQVLTTKIASDSQRKHLKFNAFILYWSIGCNINSQNKLNMYLIY